jgi:hypothetical protein
LKVKNEIFPTVAKKVAFFHEKMSPLISFCHRFDDKLPHLVTTSRAPPPLMQYKDQAQLLI